jgi:hypothetical protein
MTIRAAPRRLVWFSWLLLAVSGLFAVLSVAQAIFAWIAFPSGVTPGEVGQTPIELALKYFPIFVTVVAAFWLIMLRCAFGLLQRREWARSLMVWLLRGLGSLLLLASIGALFSASGPSDQQVRWESLAAMSIALTSVAALLWGARSFAASDARHYFRW